MNGNAKDGDSGGWFLGSRKIIVDVRQVSGDSLEFNLFKEEAKRPDIVICGMVTQISGYTSIDSGEISNSHR